MQTTIHQSITDEPANRDAAEVVRQQEQWREKYGDRTTGRDGLPNQYVQVVDAALDEISTETAQKLADESVGVLHLRLQGQFLEILIQLLAAVIMILMWLTICCKWHKKLNKKSQIKPQH